MGNIYFRNPRACGNAIENGKKTLDMRFIKFFPLFFFLCQFLPSYHTSSSPLTISTVGVLGSNLRIRFRSARVTKLGVMGTTGENGW
jgi:hypothetical protein